MRQQQDLTTDELIKERQRARVLQDLENRAREKLRRSRPKRILRMILILGIVAAASYAAYSYYINR